MAKATVTNLFPKKRSPRKEKKVEPIVVSSIRSGLLVNKIADILAEQRATNDEVLSLGLSPLVTQQVLLHMALKNSLEDAAVEVANVIFEKVAKLWGMDKARELIKEMGVQQ